MEKYTHERLIKEGAKQVKRIRWPGNEYREFTGKERAFVALENHGKYDYPWIIIMKNDKETERISVRFVESIEWA